MRRLTLALLAAAGLGAVSVPAQAASGRCDALPVRATLGSSDPTTFEDDAGAIVKPKDGAAVSDVSVSVRRGGRTLAAGTLAGGLPRDGASIRLTPRGIPIRQGRATVLVSGRRSGCDRRLTTTRPWTFGTPSLPVRATPTDATADGVRLVVRAVGGRTVRAIRARLLDSAGHTVAQAARAKPFKGHVVLELPLDAARSSGRYTLRLSGRAQGEGQATWEEPLVLGSPGATAKPAPPPPAGGLVEQRVAVDWASGKWQGRDAAGFVAPGIGYGEIVCRPDAQWVRFFPSDPTHEVAMMNWTYKDWSEHQEKAIREAVHTVFTGMDFREGLNKFSPAEKHATGQFDGIISDRGPFGVPGGTFAAPTTLRITWQWDFAQQGAERCHVDATLVTQGPGDGVPLARSAQVVWRGDGNAAGRDEAAIDVPGVGPLRVTCPPGPKAVRALTIDTPQGADVTTREGSDDAMRPQPIGPVTAALPNNGMLAVKLAGGATVLASSRWKVNDPDPAQNFCFVSAQVVVPAA